MWAATFQARLASWTQLRATAQNLPKPQCLATINEWWFDSPWRPYYLHWDDRAQWPDPWQLLEENTFCSLARALGIMYTICLMDRPDIQDAELLDRDNLVLVDQKKYILNWSRDQLLNISLIVSPVQRSISQAQIKTQIK